jgi:hypothetical protein
MSMNLSTLRYLPGVSHYLSQIKEDLSAGNSVISIIPEQVPLENVWQTGLDMLWQMNLDVEEIDLVHSEYQESPLHFLLRQYSQSVNGDETIQSLASCILPAVIAVRGISSLPREQAHIWVDFFRAWAIQAHATASTSSSPQKPPCLWGTWTPCSPQDVLPENETWFRVRPWWSLLSLLDIRLICRLTEGVGQTQTSIKTTWREALLPYLAGPDLDLANHLWPILENPKDEIYQSLIMLATKRGWTANKLEKWGLVTFLKSWQRSSRSFIQMPKQIEKTLWLHGVIYQMPDYGLQVSAVALAVLEKWDNLDHSLWRGQASLLLPIIDEHRVSICHELTERYGSNWVLSWSKPITSEAAEELKKSPLAAEWGHLESAILRSPYRDEQHRLRNIRFLRGIRNKLAHYRPISYKEYELLMSMIA